jgi:hypothetical protein
MRRWWISVAFLLVTNVVMATPGAADSSWQPVTLTANFYCATTPGPAGVETKTCVVVKDNEAQAVVIVANSGGSRIAIEALHVQLLFMGSLVYDAHCARFDLSPGTTRGCSGQKIPADSGSTVQTRGQVLRGNSTSWDVSPPHRV